LRHPRSSAPGRRFLTHAAQQSKSGEELVPKPTFNPAATAIANWVLTLTLIASLRQKRILTYDQAIEIVEQTLLTLESLQGRTKSAAFKEARAMLEDFRLAIGEDRDRASPRSERSIKRRSVTQSHIPDPAPARRK
jgi:hypothetical protein